LVFILFLFSYLYLAKKSVISLLSLLLPSCIVAPIKELANTLFSKVLSTNSMAQIPSNINIDIDFDMSRRRSVSSSNKSLRESSMHSAASSIPYYKIMEIQSNNPL